MAGLLIFGFFTLVHAAVAVVALSFAAHPDLGPAALCLFLVEAATAFDNGVTVIGRSLGVSPWCERLNRYRFLLHAVCIGFLLPVYAGIANAFAVEGVWASFLVTGSWVAAVLIAVYGYTIQYGRLETIMPVDYFGCLRYAQSVTAATRYPGYEYSDAELAARGSLPVASVVTTTLGLLIAAVTGWLGAFWVPFVVTAIMYVAAAFPPRGWGPVVTSCLEIVFSVGLCYSLAAASALQT